MEHLRLESLWSLPWWCDSPIVSHWLSETAPAACWSHAIIAGTATAGWVVLFPSMLGTLGETMTGQLEVENDQLAQGIWERTLSRWEQFGYLGGLFDIAFRPCFVRYIEQQSIDTFNNFTVNLRSIRSKQAVSTSSLNTVS